MVKIASLWEKCIHFYSDAPVPERPKIHESNKKKPERPIYLDVKKLSDYSK